MTDLHERIKQRIWRCNELTEKQSEDCAWIAMNEMQKWLTECRTQIPGDARLSSTAEIIPLPNKALRGVSMPGMEAVRQSEGV